MRLSMRFISGCLLGLMSALQFGCGAGEPDQATAPSVTATASAVPAKASQITQADGKDLPMLALWSHSCALCHVDGNAGAPRMGNVDEWGSRLAKGEAVLLQHTLEGFNQMPPLGYCMACERSDFVAMIEFMTQGMSAGEIAQ